MNELINYSISGSFLDQDTLRSLCIKVVNSTILWFVVGVVDFEVVVSVVAVANVKVNNVMMSLLRLSLKKTLYKTIH